MGGETTLKDIAKHIGISARYLHGIFKQVTGSTPAAYAARFKDSSTTATNTTPATSQQSSTSPPTADTDYFSYNCDAVYESSRHLDYRAGDINALDFEFYTTAAAYEAAEDQLKTVCEDAGELDWAFDFDGDLPSVLDDPYAGLDGSCMDVDFVESCSPTGPASFGAIDAPPFFQGPDFTWNEGWGDFGMNQPILV